MGFGGSIINNAISSALRLTWYGVARGAADKAKVAEEATNTVRGAVDGLMGDDRYGEYVKEGKAATGQNSAVVPKEERTGLSIFSWALLAIFGKDVNLANLFRSGQGPFYNANTRELVDIPDAKVKGRTNAPEAPEKPEEKAVMPTAKLETEPMNAEEQAELQSSLDPRYQRINLRSV